MDVPTRTVTPLGPRPVPRRPELAAPAGTHGARGTLTRRRSQSPTRVPSQTVALPSTSDQHAGRQPGVAWTGALLPASPSPLPAGLPVTSPGSSAFRSAASPVTPLEATLTSSLWSHERLNVVAASRDHSAPGRTVTWEVRAPESVNRKLTVTWSERLMLRARGDLVRSSQGMRGWPRPVSRQKRRWGAQWPGEGRAPVGAEAGTAGPGSGWPGERPGAQDAVRVPSRHGAGLGPSGWRVVSWSCRDKASRRGGTCPGHLVEVSGPLAALGGAGTPLARGPGEPCCGRLRVCRPSIRSRPDHTSPGAWDPQAPPHSGPDPRKPACRAPAMPRVITAPCPHSVVCEAAVGDPPPRGPHGPEPPPQGAPSSAL